MIVMQYANNGSLLSYLDQNINKLTWKMKLQHLSDSLHNYSAEVGDWEITEELQTFTDNLMNLEGFNIEENV
jgi:hypothetical protein